MRVPIKIFIETHSVAFDCRWRRFRATPSSEGTRQMTTPMMTSTTRATARGRARRLAVAFAMVCATCAAPGAHGARVGVAGRDVGTSSSIVNVELGDAFAALRARDVYDTAAPRASDDGDDVTSCVARLTREGVRCEEDVRAILRDFEDGSTSAADAAARVSTAATQCVETMHSIADECHTMSVECESTFAKIAETCAGKFAKTREACASGDEAPAECAARVARLAQACAVDAVTELAKCVGELGTVVHRHGGDDPDDPDDCDAQERALEEKCHRAYDDIKDAIKSGAISVIDGMKQLAKLGRQCAKDAMALHKKCHPDGPPHGAVAVA